MELFQFIESMCTKYSIDESHGLKHAKGTFLKARVLLETLKDVEEDERRVALYSAALHDTCDSKYTDVTRASMEICDWLLTQGMIEDEINGILSIITTMSYSKLKASAAGGPPVYPDHGKWNRAYHVARHADLLEGFIVARCFLYNIHIHPGKNDDEHWELVRELFNRRIFTYLEDGWIYLPGALEMIPGLTEEAHRCLDGRLLDWADASV